MTVIKVNDKPDTKPGKTRLFNIRTTYQSYSCHQFARIYIHMRTHTRT